MKSTIRNNLAALLIAAVFTACATGKDQAELQSRSRISRAEAEKTALAKVSGGKIKEGGLEEEKGKLIWSFDISTPGNKDVTEIQIDAITGQIVSIENETPAQQKQEREADKKKR